MRLGCGAAPSVVGQAWSTDLLSIDPAKSLKKRKPGGCKQWVAVVVNLYAGRDCSIFRNGCYLLWRNPENGMTGHVMRAHRSGQRSTCAARAHKIKYKQSDVT